MELTGSALCSSKKRHTSDSQEEEGEGAEKAGNPWNRTFQTLLRCHLDWGYGILESGKPEFLTARCLWWYYDNDVDIDDVDIDNVGIADVAIGDVGISFSIF